MRILNDAELQEAYNNATPAQQAEFNRRHRVCLKIAIVIKVALLLGLIAIGLS